MAQPGRSVVGVCAGTGTSPFYPERAKVVQVDIRGENIGRRVAVDVPLVGGVRETIGGLLPLLREGRDGEHLSQMRAHYRRTRSRFDSLAKAGRRAGPMHPQTLVAAVDRLAEQDAVFLPDVGTPTLWAARYLTMNGRRRLIGSFNHGTMANALPQAIGVQAAHPGRQVVTLSGDGGLAMLLGELVTLRQLKLPVKVVVSVAQAKGFALWAGRSVLGGAGDEVIEVAGTNLRQLKAEL